MKMTNLRPLEENSPEITKTDNHEFEFIPSDGIIAKTNGAESNH